MKHSVKTCCFFCGLFCILLFGSCRTIEEPISKSGFYLNTFVTVTLYDSRDETLLESCMKLCGEYEQIFSRTREDSELYLLNNGNLRNREGISRISHELYELISMGLYYGELSQGRLDITVAPITSLWNFSSGGEVNQPPDQDLIQQALSLVDYKKVELYPDNQVYLPQGMELDLGAVAKGYIADRMKEYLLNQGVRSAVINLGGNILCIGGKTSKEPFRIGIQQPFQQYNETVAVMKITDISVVTSGIYERCFTTEEGTFYHHILNPDTGYPCDNSLLSVTIAAESSMEADALSTACFCLGLEEGMKLLDSLPDAYGVFITEDRELHYSAGFREAIEVMEK